MKCFVTPIRVPTHRNSGTIKIAFAIRVVRTLVFVNTMVFRVAGRVPAVGMIAIVTRPASVITGIPPVVRAVAWIIAIGKSSVTVQERVAPVIASASVGRAVRPSVVPAFVSVV